MTQVAEGGAPGWIGGGRELAWLYELFRLGQRLPRERPDQVRQRLLEQIVRGFEASSGCLALTGEDGSLTIVAGINLPDSVIGTRVEPGERILGQVARNREAMLLNGDLPDDPGAAPRTSPRPASALCWPLVIDDRLIGVVSINRSVDEAPFAEPDVGRGQLTVDVISLMVENALLHEEQHQRIRVLSELNDELRVSNMRLEEAHAQLLQSEKLASIGQLAAGIAHEINNPVGYISSNFTTLQNYVDELLGLLSAYEAAGPDPGTQTEAMARISALREEMDLAFLRDDVRDLMRESLEGITRVKRIVKDLKDFAHTGEGEWETADLHKGLDSTLNIVHNELKYKAEVVREYGDLPPVECIPSQLNQVFMNLLVNAAQAIEEQGTITVRTGTEGDQAWVEVTDTGKGIAPEHVGKLFDPFFTTKPVGQGTGLGLSLSYGIVTKHGGHIDVDSAPGRGSAFRVWIPMRHEGTPPA